MKSTLIITFSILFFSLSACFDKAPDDKTIMQETRLTAKNIETSGIWGTYTEAGPLFNEHISAVIIAANKVSTKRLYPGMRQKVYFQDLELKSIKSQMYLLGITTIVNLYDNSEKNSFIAIEMEKDSEGNVILGTVINECHGDLCSQCEWTGEKCNCKDYTSTNKCNHKLVVTEDSSD
ncbi:MAG: hypothetical protein HOM78_07020 [Candidatus Marinimicrobia bacterium]|mgnify:FL=1|jgi:hypothetical protein|nr:hypothetical protein [Candidatus Neomarinimicrobiota bacterium]MBT4957526.1 hypothetical protein [Candidatus Neomarinimicrobiota bacterium]MBT5364145.1 hypothetical protein [Candidatus Neomarinimicrobiota bacterium]